MKACPACNTRYPDDISFCARDGTPVVPDPNAAVEAAAADAMIGQVIADRYKLVRKLGEGGMGEVYVAEHVHIEKKVALKLLRAEIVSNAEAVTRFRQEARSASSIGHENIIEIEDFGNLPDGRVYLAMELLQGAPLNDMLKQPLPFGQLLDILIQTCGGLAAAHAKGIVHRDMKPENVYVTRTKDGRDCPKILDFGIAKVSGSDGGQQHLTRTGTIFGTPFYMAPEQAMAQPMDHRVDIYAMGVILYEALTGKRPFEGETYNEIMFKIISEPFPAPTELNPSVPPPVEQVIFKAMSRDAADRFATAGEMRRALDSAARGLEVDFSARMSTAPTIAHTPGSTTGRTPMSAAYTPAAGTSTNVSAPPRRGLKIGIAVGAALLLGAGALAFVLVSGGAPEPAPVPPAIAAPVPAPPPAAVAPAPQIAAPPPAAPPEAAAAAPEIAPATAAVTAAEPEAEKAAASKSGKKKKKADAAGASASTAASSGDKKDTVKGRFGTTFVDDYE